MTGAVGPAERREPAASAPASEDATLPFRPDTLVVTAVALGAVLRLAVLDRNGLWLDELASVRAAGRETIGALTAEVAADIHPPLYFLLLRAWTAVAGTTDLVLRLPSALVGIASIVGTAAVAGRLGGRASAGLAALVLATAPFSVSLDREVRANALVAALSVAGLLLLARRPRGWPWGWAVISAALLWIHPFAPFVILAQLAWGLLQALETPSPASLLRSDAVRLVLAAALAGAAVLPWVPTVRAQLAGFSSDPWYAIPPGDTLGWLWGAIHLDNTSLATLVTLAALLGARNPAVATLVATHLAALVFVPQVLGWTVAPFLRDRNVLPLLPVAAVAAGIGLASLPDRRVRAAAATVLAALGALHAARDVFRAEPGEDWRGAAEIVRAGYRPGDTLVGTFPILWRHYLPDLTVTDTLPDPVPGRTWILQGHTLDDAQVAALESRATILLDRRLPGVRVVLAEPGSHPVDVAPGATAPVRDTEGVHFYWGLTTRSEPVGASGTCVIGVTGHGDPAGGQDAQLALRWIAPDGSRSESVVELGPEERLVYGSPATVVPGSSVELAFLNDGSDAEGGDRNAHARRVVWECR